MANACFTCRPVNVAETSFVGKSQFTQKSRRCCALLQCAPLRQNMLPAQFRFGLFLAQSLHLAALKFALPVIGIRRPRRLEPFPGLWPLCFMGFNPLLNFFDVALKRRLLVGGRLGGAIKTMMGQHGAFRFARDGQHPSNPLQRPCRPVSQGLSLPKPLGVCCPSSDAFKFAGQNSPVQLWLGC